MIGTNDLQYEPLDYYNHVIKDEFEANAREHLEGLKEKADVDVEANRATCKKIEELRKKESAVNSSLNNKKFLRVLTIIGIVLGGILITVGAVMFVNLERNESALVPTLLLVFGFIDIFASIYLLVGVVNKKIKETRARLNSIQSELNKQLAIARQQLAPLTSLFSFKDYINVVNKTNTTFSLDERLEAKKLRLLELEFGFNSATRNDDSIINVLSGNLDENPFIKVRVKQCRINDFTYTGTRLVSWVETYRSNGRTYTRTQTQTLVATYTAPRPFYNNSTATIYANKAAPDLTFSRYPTNINGMDEDDIEKFVRKQEKELEKRGEKAIAKGRNYQPMGNSKFEAFFDGLDRNHEIQYRLLFTPIAQQNMVDLVTQKTPYGDDFTFVKDHMINYIYSKHANTEPFTFSVGKYYSYYSYDALIKDYVQDMIDAHQVLYFDLIPLLSIPLYTMTEPSVFDIVQELPNFSLYEAEAAMNHLDAARFDHPDTKTDHILKAHLDYKKNGTDVYSITSYSFDSIPHVENIPVMARNGNTYLVPVTWYEFIPLEKTTKVAMKAIMDAVNLDMKETMERTDADMKDIMDSVNESMKKSRIHGHSRFEGANLSGSMTRYRNSVTIMLDDEDVNDDDDIYFDNQIKSKYNFIK